MAEDKTKNIQKTHSNFDHRGTNVPTQPKVPPMPAPKPAKAPNTQSK